MHPPCAKFGVSALPSPPFTVHTALMGLSFGSGRRAAVDEKGRRFFYHRGKELKQWQWPEELPPEEEDEEEEWEEDEKQDEDDNEDEAEDKDEDGEVTTARPDGRDSRTSKGTANLGGGGGGVHDVSKEKPLSERARVRATVAAGELAAGAWPTVHVLRFVISAAADGRCLRSGPGTGAGSCGGRAREVRGAAAGGGDGVAPTDWRAAVTSAHPPRKHR